MKKVLGLVVAISFILILGSCSLIGINSPTPPSGTASSSYPESVVYKIELSNETFLCSNFNVSNTDTAISLRLNEVYSLSSDGKLTWIGKEKEIAAVKIGKIAK
jgi:hypothetical protein